VSLLQPEMIQLDLPARYGYLHILSECIAEMLRTVEGIGDQEALTYNLQLATHEICTNIVGHAYNGDGEGRIKIALELQPEPLSFKVELHDNGRSFDMEQVPTPDLDEVRIHGYGLFLTHSLMDTVTYTSNNGANRWCLIKNLSLEG
jgi:serine/threonine-protein kinase RsbW